MERYILECSDYNQADKYVTKTNQITDYMTEYYNKGGDTRSTIENQEQYTIPRPTSPITTSTTIENDFDTMLFKMKVNAYVKQKSMIEENIQNSCSLLLG